MKQPIFRAAGIVAVLCIAVPAAAEGLALRIGSDGAYPPYGFKDEAGTLVGFEVDLAKDICARIEAQCEWVLLDFDGLIPALQNGRIDIIMAAMSRTDERDKTIDFSIPYTSGPEHFFASAEFVAAHDVVAEGIIDMFELKEAEQAVIDTIRTHLSGKAVGVLRGSTMESFLRATFPEADVRVYDKDTNTLLDLVSGRIDVAMCDGEVGAKFIAEQSASGKPFVAYGPGFRGGLLGHGVSLGLPEGVDADLRRRLNAAIIDATRDGTIPRLTVQWMGGDMSIAISRLEREAANP